MSKKTRAELERQGEAEHTQDGDHTPEVVFTGDTSVVAKHVAEELLGDHEADHEAKLEGDLAPAPSVVERVGQSMLERDLASSPNDTTDRPRLADDTMAPRAPMPRGPFVRYHEAEDRSLHAVVVAVHEDGSVNLHVFPDGPRVNYLQNVPHGYDAGCWEDYL